MSDVSAGTRTTAGQLRNAEESHVRHRGGAPFGTPESSTEALFQRQWRIYRKVVDNNYLFHREAYARLHDLLIDEMAEPFCFLDVACGDASATVDALKGTQVDNYHGIDFSRAALDIAEETLRVLGCPVKLYENDFVRALKDWREPVRVVWIGLSLHHLSTPEKLNVMRDIRQIVGLQGVFAVYENTSLDGEGSGAVASPVGSAEAALDRSHARRVGRDHGTRPCRRHSGDNYAMARAWP